jgi:sugar lactone lactonase YvrE
LDPPLASPVGIAIDESGNRLLVMELQPPELRAYHLQDGRFLETLGREGDGPGEYRHPIGLAVNGDGRAAVLSVSGRVT